MKRFTLLPVVALASFALLPICAFAGSATWNANPGSADWNTAANWTPATVPELDTDTATFGVSNTTSISNSNKLGIAGIEFLPGASAYTITWITQRAVTFVGTGVTNDSGVLQKFIVGNDIGFKQAALTFAGHTTAGQNTRYTNYGSAGMIDFADESSAGTATLINLASSPDWFGGVINFHGSSSADHATVVNSANTSQNVPGQINFFDKATAGNATFSNPGGRAGGHGGQIQFFGTATAGQGAFINEGALSSEAESAAYVWIYDGASAGSASFTVNGGNTRRASGAQIYLTAGADAGNATFTINGGQAPGALGGHVGCAASSGNATFLVNGGTVSGALGGLLGVSGLDDATIITSTSANGGGVAQIDAGGDTIGARIQLLGDGWLNVAQDPVREVTVGSIEGTGRVSLGQNDLSVGSNNLSTIFSGTIEDGDFDRRGILTKIGTGTLTLTGANSYTGGTIVESGILLANNTTGSGTGAGAVQVNGGTFGGGGKVSGDVIVGTGTGAGAILGPGARGIIPGTLTIKRTLTLMTDATYKCTLDSRTPAADQVKAKGVIIEGAQVLFDDRGDTVLATGTVFTVISNTAATAILGTFANLPDGGTIQIGNNTYQADYEGGDGNDLTLTVIP